MCSFQRPGRAAGRAAMERMPLKGHPRAQTQAEKEPLLFLWPRGPVMKPWASGDLGDESQGQRKPGNGKSTCLWKKHNPALIGKTCFLVYLALFEFWVSLKETVLFLEHTHTHRHSHTPEDNWSQSIHVPMVSSRRLIA